MRNLLLIILLSTVASACGGCNILGVIARAIPRTVDAQYKGMANQSIGVMVWADRGVRIDFPTLQSDLATALQARLATAQKEKAKELDGSTFPVKPQSIVRYQMDHPELEGLPVVEIATAFPVTRLIYLEVQEFATRSPIAVELFRGSVAINVKVVDISGGKATVVYEEPNVRAIFPPKSREEGAPGLDDMMIYNGTYQAVADEIARLFLKHDTED